MYVNTVAPTVRWMDESNNQMHSDAAYAKQKPQIVEYPETSLKWRSHKNQLLLNHMQMQVTELETVNKAEIFYMRYEQPVTGTQRTDVRSVVYG